MRKIVKFLNNHLRDAIDKVRKQEKNSDISEDESRDLQDEIQKVTDLFTTKIDELLVVKEKELTSI